MHPEYLYLLGFPGGRVELYTTHIPVNVGDELNFPDGFLGYAGKNFMVNSIDRVVCKNAPGGGLSDKERPRVILREVSK